MNVLKNDNSPAGNIGKKLQTISCRKSVKIPSLFFQKQNLYFSSGKAVLKNFFPVDDLNKKLKQLENRYREVKSLWKEMGDKAPENVKVIPDVLDGEATYALEILTTKGIR
ncbi:MAG: hypothetical protein Ct9H300mP28_01500 [Pseudomonadota bacterium]|nr:MAG: hypothetical protein Ct9H300mP28_01500 [Pseudomonadota bacterium]